ncbi:MAG: tRNA (N(6)-L-threonylcarbamoyladenosine(37)-C(2))-methylthiotransferase MtaB [Bacteroidetes bacterium]|nr:tRNA (N(6)-L-threonylcarbamoyladenosine(37)-C(2))-methylthiotransferase MtaB [Bacteroidota bacterium]
MNSKVALHTLGCKLNFSETSTIGKQFLSNGFEIVDFKDKADVYVFNTCTVTQNAERECRQLVRRVLRKNPEAFVVVTGCYAQLRPQEISDIPGVDAVLGSNEKFNLFNILNDFKKSELACIYVGSLNNVTDFGEAHSTDADSRTRAYFKIQDGCDYKCTFCTIPLARGSSRSMNPQYAVDEFKRLIDQGYKEIILTGVNVGDYGKSFGYNFFQLLTKLININGDFRIRISSIEPNLLTEDIIDLISGEKKLCNHLHIPLQSGSQDILKAMQRRYSVKDYEKIIFNANEKIEYLGVGVDVIVGFPGETENHFIETYNFLRDLPISYLHVFTYSERPDTKAINLTGKVEITEKKRRNKILRTLSEKKKHQFYKQMLGRDLDVLFEDELIDNKMKGFTSNYVRVINEYDQSFINELTSVNLNRITAEGICTGNILDTKNSIELILI